MDLQQTHSALRQPVTLNAAAVQAGLIRSLCRAAAWAAAATPHVHEQDSQSQMPMRSESVCDGVLLHATLTLAYLSHDDHPTAAAVVSEASAQHCVAALTATIMRRFSLVSPSSPSRSALDRTSQTAHASVSACFTTHSTQLIGLLALLMGHDPDISAGGVHHRQILGGDSALSALQLLAGAWPFLQGESRRWAALAVCTYLPLLYHQTSSSTHANSAAAVSRCAIDGQPNVDRANSNLPPPSSTSFPASLLSQSPRSPRARLNPHVAIGSLSSPPSAAAAAVNDVTLLPSHHAHQVPPAPDVPATPPNDQGVMSALYSNQYARFHPLLTFALRLQVPSAVSAAQ